MATLFNLKEETDQFYSFDVVAEDAAAEQNCKVVYPKPNQIQLDIDTDDQYELFLRRFQDMYNRLNWDYEVEEKESKSGLPHRHITITITNGPLIDERDRLLLQTMLGSDQVRESLNIFRYFCGIENPTRLFEPIEEEG
jgi:hypothetical protein